MMPFLPQLTAVDFAELASVLRSGRLAVPISAAALQQVLPLSVTREVAQELARLFGPDASPELMARVLEAISAERALPNIQDLVDLVTTGPEASGISNRDTSVVVRELFAQAQESVVVAGYAIHRGRTVFEALAARMLERPSLAVRLFLDVQRPYGDTSTQAELLCRFMERFSAHEWPSGARVPSLFYFPRSLDPNPGKRASLHAKCVVVDEAVAFVSSANFTEAAHEKNIEVGVLIRSIVLANRLVRHFNALAASRELLPIPRGPSL